MHVKREGGEEIDNGKTVLNVCEILHAQKGQTDRQTDRQKDRLTLIDMTKLPWFLRKC